MGLIRAILGSALGTLGDEWLEFIYCDSLSGDVLMQKGTARSGRRSGNTGRDDNIISDGSKIAVNEGQCMLVVENGRIVDFCAEPGGYIYNTLSEPSLFDNSNYWLRESFEKMGKRFRSGGQPMNDQRVYYVNTKEILNNKIGIGNIPFRDGEFSMTLMLKGFGTYSYRIKDPVAFYTNICANVADKYARLTLEPQLRAEMQSALLPVLGRLSLKNVRYDQLPMMTEEIAASLNEELSAKWRERRGLEIASLVITSIRPDDESVDKIRQLQESSIYAGRTSMLGARIGAAQANAMENAAANEGGSMSGFMGMNMAFNAGGVNANTLINQQPASTAQEEEHWRCACGTDNTMLFCIECGAKKPEDDKSWICSCGRTNKGKFCGKCGQPKPMRYKCDKCGYMIEAQKLPKFCPKCGDPIDGSDACE